MRQIRLALWKRNRQFCARVHFAEEHTGDRVGPPAAGIPRFQDAAHLIGPGHGYRAAGLEHYDRVRICGRDLGNQIILPIGKREVIEIHSFAFPLVSEYDGHVRRLRQSGCRCRISTRIVLNIRVRGLRPNRFQR